MSALPEPVPKLTPEEYLEGERLAETKSEYFNGEVYALAGARENHVLICGNVHASLHGQFRGRKCRAYSNELRVRVEPGGSYVYPDVVALCGMPEFEDDQFDTLLNPMVIIEVLSESTETRDRGWKAQHYQKLPSLREYVFIAPDEVRIEHYIRQEGGMWLLWTCEELDGVLRLGSVECEIPVADIYEKVEFPSPAGEPAPEDAAADA